MTIQQEVPFTIPNIQLIMKQKLQNSPNLILRQINPRTFKIVSKQNFGQISMVEKEHFTIKGRFNPQRSNTLISYEVKGNATFSIFSIILPIMLLPTLIIGAAGNKEFFFTNISIYVLISGLSIAFLLNLEQQYRRKGAQVFKEFLNSLVAENK